MAAFKSALKFLFGTKPDIPEYRDIDAGTVQKQTVQENIAAVPGAEKLAAEYNRFGAQELAKALEFGLPGGLGRAQRNITAQLEGELSPEDTSALIRNATAAGFGRGLQQGGIGRNLVLRDLGLSTLAQRERGLQNFATLAQIAAPKQFDIASMFYTPQQRLQFAASERDQRFNRDLLAEQIKAAPDPAGLFTQQLVIALAGSAGKAIGAGACWVAREIFGENDLTWMSFRAWLYAESPNWFFRFYLRHGEKIAAWLKRHPMFKPIVRLWMLSKIKRWP